MKGENNVLLKGRLVFFASLIKSVGGGGGGMCGWSSFIYMEQKC